MTTVIIERELEHPTNQSQLQQLREAKGWCFQTNNVAWMLSTVSADGLKVICLYEAPDVEAVRRANKQAELPATRIYAADLVARGEDFRL